MRPALAAALAGLAIAQAASAAEAQPGRPFTVDDLLHLSRFEGASVSPDDRHVVVSFTAPYDQAFTYADETSTDLALGRVAVLDTAARSPRLRTLPDGGRGLTAGAFSPSGRRLLLFRFDRGGLRVGARDMKTGAVRWSSATPERDPLGRMAAWLSDRELLLVSPSASHRPIDLTGAAAMRRIEQLWAAKRAGRPAVTLRGSGRFADLGRTPRDVLLRLDAVTGRLGPAVPGQLISGDIEDIQPSPDGRRVAMIVRGADAPLSDVNTLVPADDGSRRRLRLVDLATGAAEELAGADVLAGLLSWSPDGERVLVFARADAQPDWDRGRYLIVSPDAHASPVDASGTLHPVLTEIASEGRKVPHAAWLGDTPVVLARQGAGERQDWWGLTPAGPRALTAALPDPPTQLAAADLQGVLLFDSGRAWRLTAAGASLLQAGSGLASAEPARLDAGYRGAVNDPPRRDWALASDTAAGGSVVLRVGAGAPAGQRLEEGEELAAHTAFAAAGWRVGADGIGTLRLIRGSSSQTLMRLNPKLHGVAFAKPRLLLRPDASGTPRRDWLYLPPRLATPRRPALVILPYPGSVHPSPWAVAKPGFLALTANPQLLAANGYAVLVPSLPRPEGRGAAAGVVEEIDAAAHAAIASGRIDPDRIALWGQSFGGYAALLTATRSRLFKAVIAQAAPSDLVSAPGADDPKWRPFPSEAPSLGFLSGWSEAGQAQFRKPAWRDPGAYLRDSPLSGVEQVTTPLLLLHGDRDFISITQPEEMFTALRRLDKDVVLATFWGEDHLVESPGNVRKLYRLALQFLAATLDGHPPSAAAQRRSDGASTPLGMVTGGLPSGFR